MTDDMMCCPLDGGDRDAGPECFAEATRTARKEHACCECGKPIAKGTQYHYESGVWEGRPGAFKTCLPCVDIRVHFSCGKGWVYQELWSQLADNFFPDMKAGGKCMEGLSPRGKAKLFEMYLEWYEQGEHDGAPPPRPYTPNEGAPPHG